MQATEAWMIGVLLLVMGTLVPEEAIYDWKAFELKEQELKQLLNEIKHRYSVLFYELISSCLDLNPDDRPTLSDILGYLQKRKIN